MFYLEETVNTRTFLHCFEGERFCLLLPLKSRNTEEILACVAKIKRSDVSALDAHLWKKWDEVAKLLKYTDKRVEDIFCSFMGK